MSEELKEKRVSPGEIPAEDYPFFVATPVKAKNTGWKVLSLALAAALTVSVYLLWSGWSFRPAEPQTDPDTQTRIAALQTRLENVETENAQLQAKIEELTGQNTNQANRIIELLNQCNNLSMKLEQAKNNSLTEEEITEISDALEAYELIIQAQVALLQRDQATLETCVQKLLQDVDSLPANVRSALYVIMEYMDKT